MLSNFVKGDTIELEVTVNVDITGWELRCEIYDKSGSSIKLANLASGGGNSQIEITDATNGVFLITVAKDLTTNFEDKSFIEIEREDDGQWIAEVPDIPGVMAYGTTRQDAVTKAEALALRIIADRIDHGETIPELDEMFAVPA